MSMKIVFINKGISVDPDAMQYSVAFRPDIHCLQTHLITGFKYTKGLNILTPSIHDTHSKVITRL